jgi:hypothetical protein
MKRLYIVYFRTMVDSPEVTIECATTSRFLAERALLQAKRQEEEWMADEDEDSGNWAEACIRKFDNMPDTLKEGDTIHVVVNTRWEEEVDTWINAFVRKDEATNLADYYKQWYLADYPGLTPFDEDETIEEATHLEDPDVAVDIYVDIQSVTLQ